jgi:hypothetical protein
MYAMDTGSYEFDKRYTILTVTFHTGGSNKEREAGLGFISLVELKVLGGESRFPSRRLIYCLAPKLLPCTMD